ncbi:MAG: hypothetical protein V4556_00115 [Bacteroidota bacterium]
MKRKSSNFKINHFVKNVIIIFSIIIAFGLTDVNITPIYFREFGIEIFEIGKIGDTLFYNKSNKENFKLIFEDTKGKCSFERYIKGKLYQKGQYSNSLDTLKRYVSSRNVIGRTSIMKVQKYFEPLKHGEWLTFKSGKIVKENYLNGILQ